MRLVVCFVKILTACWKRISELVLRMKYIHEYGSQIVVAATVGVAALVGGLVRKVFTNEQKLQLLASEIKHRDEIAQRDNEKLNQIYEQVQELTKWARDKS